MQINRLNIKSGFVRCVLLLVLFFMFFCGQVMADDIPETTVSDMVYGVVEYYKTQELDSWEQLVALDLAGEDLTKWQNIGAWDADELDEGSLATAFAGRTLGLLALYENPADYDGQNLIEGLKNKQNDDGSFGGSINNTVWAIIALDEAKADYDEDKAISYLVSQKKDDGGYAIFGDAGDPDVTGDVLLALSSHRSIDGVNDAIDGAIGFLKSVQLETAGFESWDAENSQSSAKVMTGLLAVGEDILGDSWKQDGKTIIDALAEYRLPDYSFKFSHDGNSNDMATRQALRALADLKVNGYGDYLPNCGDRDDPADPAEATVRVRVEGHAGSLADEMVTTSGSALDALELAVGEENLSATGGLISTIKGEGSSVIGQAITSWMYYVIRDGAFDDETFNKGPGEYEVKTGDEIVFYIAAFDPITWESYTHIPDVTLNPQSITAGQALTISINAKKYDMWESKLTDLTAEEVEAIGNYIVTANGKEYISQFGQVTIPNVAAGTLKYSVSNQNDMGYPNVVTYRDEIEVGEAISSKVNVRVEGAQKSITNATVSVPGTALDALVQVLDNNDIDYEIANGYISSIAGEEAGRFGGWDGWIFLVNGEPASVGAGAYNVQENDELIFYYGMYPGQGTIIPEITINPSDPRVNQEITVTVSNKQKLDEKVYQAEVAFIGGLYFTNQEGQAVIPGPAAAGTYYLRVSKDVEGSWPEIVRTGEIPIIVSGDNGGSQEPPDNKIRVDVEIIGKNKTHFSGRVTLDENNATPLKALKATGIPYKTRDNNSYVYEIAGEREDLSGTAGWKYKVGSKIPNAAANEYPLRDGDNLLWFWASDYSATEPGDKEEKLQEELPGLEDMKRAVSDAVKRLDDVVKQDGTPPGSIPAEIAVVPSTVIGEDKQMTEEQRKALEKLLKDNVVSMEQRVEAGKGSNVTDEQNEIILRIDKDALDKPIEISVNETTGYKDAVLPLTHKSITPVYEFGPKGTVFNRPVYMSIRAAIPNDVNPGDLVLAWYNEELKQWFSLPTVVDVSTGTITGLVEHFTKFAVLAREKPPVQFKDVSEGEIPWAAREISFLATKEIVHGVGEDRFEPDRVVSRAEFTAMLVKALGLNHKTSYRREFEDVRENDWYAGYIHAAVDAGIINGLTENTFKPTDEVTREQLAVMIARVLEQEDIGEEKVEFSDSVHIASWAKQGVAKAVTKGILKGFPDNTFRPREAVSRKESAVVIYRLLINERSSFRCL